jgi:hypothetical protein
MFADVPLDNRTVDRVRRLPPYGPFKPFERRRGENDLKFRRG